MSLILFDFDGVLADTLADMLQFAQEACDELGVKHVVNQNDLNSLETMSFAEYGRACEVPEQLVDEFVRICLGKFAGKPSPPALFDGLAEVIMKLAERHTSAIVTGNTSENVKAFLASHGLEGCVRAIFGVDAPGSKVEKIVRARGQLAREDEAVFMVGDSLSDVRAAQEAGVKSIAVSWGHQSLERLRSEHPDYVVHSPREIVEVVDKISTEKENRK